MGRITIEPLTGEAFAPFGAVLAPPDEPGRVYADGALGSLRPAARPSLSFATVTVAAALPLVVTRMERHEKSSQSFVPLSPAPFLVVVAPHGPQGLPDPDRARAFVAAGGGGVTYAANVWHHPLTVLEAPARFAIFMWLAGTADDEEFVDVAPFEVVR